jgi:hypothetical protein
MERFANVIVVLLASLAVFAVRAQPVANPKACSSDIQAVVAAALKHALVDARDLPDLYIVEQSNPIHIFEHVWGTECVVENTALPTSAGRTYTLLGRDQARELVKERGKSITFAQAGDVKVVGDQASVWVGAAVRLANDDKHELACCCGGQMFLRRQAGAWAFLRWETHVCA